MRQVVPSLQAAMIPNSASEAIAVTQRVGAGTGGGVGWAARAAFSDHHGWPGTTTL